MNLLWIFLVKGFKSIVYGKVEMFEVYINIDFV